MLLFLIGKFEIFCLVIHKWVDLTWLLFMLLLSISGVSGYLLVVSAGSETFDLVRFDDGHICCVSIVAISKKTIVDRLLLFNSEFLASHVIRVAISTGETLSFIHVEYNDISVLLLCFLTFTRVLF